MFGISFSWRRPDNLGVKDGRFARCKRSPNCVCSQADPADREHYIAPIAYGGDMAALRRLIESLSLARLIRVEGNYLYAEFRTPVLQFVDDVELLLEDGVIHVRSASRLGRRDFGANRKRIESLRQLLTPARG